MKMPHLFGQPLYVYVAVIVAIWFLTKSGTAVVTAAIETEKKVSKKVPVNSNDPNVPKSRLNNASQAKPEQTNWVSAYPDGFAVLR